MGIKRELRKRGARSEEKRVGMEREEEERRRGDKMRIGKRDYYSIHNPLQSTPSTTYSYCSGLNCNYNYMQSSKNNYDTTWACWTIISRWAGWIHHIGWLVLSTLWFPLLPGRVLMPTTDPLLTQTKTPDLLPPIPVVRLMP